MLLLREEIACLLVLAYVYLYTVFAIKRLKMKKFRNLCATAIVHICFDCIRVITMNTTPLGELLNRSMQLLFYDTVLLFALLVTSYVFDWTFSKKASYRILMLMGAVYLIFVVGSLFLPINYIEGEGSVYTSGPCVYFLFGMIYFMALLSMAILFWKRKQIDQHLFLTIFPVYAIYLAICTAQIFIPNMMFTAAGVTILTLGVFFSIENPAKVYSEKAFTDPPTGVRNRGAYEEDFKRFEDRIEQMNSKKIAIGIVSCDLNGLKYANDHFGHTIGDKMIHMAAQVMKSNMIHAKEIYRTGGDEFVALYENKDENAILGDIANCEAACERETVHEDFPLSLAMGYAINDGVSETLSETFIKSDVRMYEKKLAMKAKDPRLVRA